MLEEKFVETGEEYPMTTLYKVLNKDGSAFHGGAGSWFLPHGNRPGKWMPRITNPTPCTRGYHVLKPEMLIHWLGPAIFAVEVRGKGVWEEAKGVVEQARLLRRLDTWNEQTARLFACDCAERVMHRAKDKRDVNAILVERRYAFGLATQKELAAGWTAERSWQTIRLFQYLNGEVDLAAMLAKLESGVRG
jgi:hypothetical protein